ncbi:MAG: hypothetical protein DHS20C16_00210 [Phycisphaerae bacterium]|nr:MAG: hypothetical protein DHS20C16_00210 [Phycisphaerae bacterium]
MKVSVAHVLSVARIFDLIDYSDLFFPTRIVGISGLAKGFGRVAGKVEINLTPGGAAFAAGDP